MTSSPRWRKAELGEYVELATGFPFKSAQFTEDPKDVRLLRGDNVGQGFLRWDGVKRWPRNNVEQFAEFQVRKGDVILAMDRPWIAAGLKYGWVTERDVPALLVQRVARMRGRNGLHTDFLRYLIGSKEFTDHVLSITTGVNVPHISARDIKAFRFDLPPIAIQRRIASVLSAYDDLIENNTRRIAILEETVRRYFESFATLPRATSQRAGWRLIAVSDIAELSGRSISPGASPNEIFSHYSIPRFDEGQLPSDEPGAAIMSNKIEFSAPTVLLSKLNPRFPRVWLVQQSTDNRSICSTEFLPLRPRPGIPVTFLAALCDSAIFRDHMKGLAHGTSTSHQRAKPNDVLALKVYIPPSNRLNQIAAFLDPLYRATATLRQSNVVLRAARDLLLPKLISGEIDVSKAEAAKEPEAA